jgi:hypothetical protein
LCFSSCETCNFSFFLSDIANYIKSTDELVSRWCNLRRTERHHKLLCMFNEKKKLHNVARVTVSREDTHKKCIYADPLPAVLITSVLIWFNRKKSKNIYILCFCLTNRKSRCIWGSNKNFSFVESLFGRVVVTNSLPG